MYNTLILSASDVPLDTFCRIAIHFSLPSNSYKYSSFFPENDPFSKLIQEMVKHFVNKKDEF